jgi:hypothetical protein
MYPAIGRAAQMYLYCNVPPCHGWVHLNVGTTLGESTTNQAELKHQLMVAATEARRAGVKYDKQVQIGQQLRRDGCAGVCLPA